MSWDFRVVKQNERFAIHYAYYNEADDVVSISETPVSPDGDDVEDLQEMLRLMIEGSDAPVIDYETLKPLETGRERA